MKPGIVVAHAFGAQVFFFRDIEDRQRYLETHVLPGPYVLVDPTDWQEQ